jgi:hypothetical protein
VVDNKLPQLVDDADCVLVAFLLRISPGEQAVTSQHDAVAVWTLLHRAPQHHGQFESRALPRHPDEMVVKPAIELFHLFPPVGGSSQRYAPVWMQMIDVWEGEKPVEGSVNRSRNTVFAEGAQRIHVHHLIFVLGASIFVLQSVQLFGVERRQPAQLDAAQVAAAALDPQYFLLFPAERVHLLYFRTGVASAKICDAKIRAQLVRTVAQQFRWVKGARDLLVPTVFQITQTCFDMHLDALGGKVFRNAVTVSSYPSCPRASKSRSYHTPRMQ